MFLFGPCSQIKNMFLMKRIAATAPAGADLTSWRY
jgi:hypothetical protein